MRGERSRDDSGYILFGITILLVILAISLVAAVPLWQKAVQREREQELIFRGYQYMQAIERYQRKYPGAYPPNVDVLVEEKFLRKAYKDPLGGEKGEWSVLRQLSPELQMGGQLPQQQLREQAGITDLNRSRAELRTPGGQRAGAQGSNRPTTGGSTRGFQSSLGRGASDASMGGIVGVASRSTEKTFYRVPGKEKYKDWLFVWGAQQGGVPGVPIPGQGPGQEPGIGPGAGQGIGQGGMGQGVGQGALGQGMGQGALGLGMGQGLGQGQQSPFPGLPPPPRLTSFGFGASPGVPGQPGQPGQPGMPGVPGQPGLPGEQGFPGTGEGGTAFPGQQGQPGFGNPGQSGFGNPGQGDSGQSGFGMQPQPRQRRRPD